MSADAVGEHKTGFAGAGGGEPSRANITKMLVMVMTLTLRQSKGVRCTK